MQTESKKLYRSRSNRMIGGVCAGLGDFFGIDATIVRLLFILAVLVSWVAPAVIVYVVMMFVVPEEPAGQLTPPGAGVAGPVEPKTTSEGQALQTGAGGRSQEPPPEPSAQGDVIHGPVGTPGEEVYREPEEENKPSTSPDELGM